MSSRVATCSQEIRRVRARAARLSGRVQMLRMVTRRVKKLVAWAIAFAVLALMGVGAYAIVVLL